MSRRWKVVAGIAILAGSAYVVARILLPADDLTGIALDPAVAFYTAGHERGFGCIDRWAYRGQPADKVIGQLSREGYRCGESSARRYSGTPFGQGTITCVSQAEWPLSRTLSVALLVDHDRHDRLVSARASRRLGDEATGTAWLAGYLSQWGWIEPETLAVRGFELDSARTLALLVVDAIATGGWRRRCEKTAPAECALDMRRRRVFGFPELPPEPVRVERARLLGAVLERIALWPPVRRGPDGNSEDSLLVRVEGEQLWLDYAGGDLVGRQVAVAIELDSDGGQPLRLMASVGDDKVVIALAGKPEQGNDGRNAFLIPEVGSAPYRIASWVYPPGQESSPESLGRFAKAAVHADPAFATRLAVELTTRLTAPSRPDETLGLYPALARIDRLAETLRDSGVVQRFMRNPGPVSDPLVRAAWALARCESRGSRNGPPNMDITCWNAQIAEDTEVQELIRAEVVRLEEVYSLLEADHPIRRRLVRLRDALAAVSTGS